jgi:hypothetical protein
VIVEEEDTVGNGGEAAAGSLPWTLAMCATRCPVGVDAANRASSFTCGTLRRVVVVCRSWSERTFAGALAPVASTCRGPAIAEAAVLAARAVSMPGGTPPAPPARPTNPIAGTPPIAGTTGTAGCVRPHTNLLSDWVPWTDLTMVKGPVGSSGSTASMCLSRRMIRTVSGL